MSSFGIGNYINEYSLLPSSSQSMNIDTSWLSTPTNQTAIATQQPSPNFSVISSTGNPYNDALINLANRYGNSVQSSVGSTMNGLNGNSGFWDYLSNNVWGTLSDAASNVWDSLVGTDGSGGFFNNNNYLGWANLGLNGYLGLQQLGIAKDSLNLSRDQWNTQKDYLAKNYANSVSDYNRAINDIANNREKILGRPGYAEQYKKDYSIS